MSGGCGSGRGSGSGIRSGPGGSGTGTGTPGPGPVVTSPVRITLDDGGSLVARGRTFLDDRGVLPARSRASAVSHCDSEDDSDRNDNQQEDEEPDWHRLAPGRVGVRIVRAVAPTRRHVAPHRHRIRHLSSFVESSGAIPRLAGTRNVPRRRGSCEPAQLVLSAAGEGGSDMCADGSTVD